MKMKKSILALLISSTALTVSAQDSSGFYNLSYSEISKKGHYSIKKNTNNKNIYRVVVKNNNNYDKGDFESIFSDIFYDTGSVVRFKRNIFGDYVSLGISTNLDSFYDVERLLANYGVSNSIELDLEIKKETVEDEPYYSNQYFMGDQSINVGANNVKKLNRQNS